MKYYVYNLNFISGIKEKSSELDSLLEAKDLLVSIWNELFDKDDVIYFIDNIDEKEIKFTKENYEKLACEKIFDVEKAAFDEDQEERRIIPDFMSSQAIYGIDDNGKREKLFCFIIDTWEEYGKKCFSISVRDKKNINQKKDK